VIQEIAEDRAKAMDDQQAKTETRIKGPRSKVKTKDDEMQ